MVSFVLSQIWVDVGVLRVGSPLHQLVDVGTGCGDWQQTHGAQDGVTTTHTIGDDEGFVTGCVGFGLQGTLGLVGRGVDPLVSFGLAVLLDQHALEDPKGD